jgi:betaine-aldehyde dehydrogenase
MAATPVPVEVRSYQHLVNGAQRAGGDAAIERLSPVTGELIARYAGGDPDDAHAAVHGARHGFDRGAWPRMTGVERSRVLLRWSELIRANRGRLAAMDTQEVGKPYLHALGTIDAAADLTEWCGNLAAQLHGDAYNTLGQRYTAMVYREPVGVVVAIVPWNAPAVIYAQKVPFALAAGCTVVVKPSEFTSSTAIELSRLALEAGVCEDALHVVTGYGHTVGQALIENAAVDMITFTGSARTARTIATTPGAALKRKAFELGGKGATIVFADADLDDAVDGTLWGVFMNAGEICCAGTRLLVENVIAEDFLKRLVDRAQQLRVGDPFDEQTDLGALIHPRHMKSVLDYIADGSKLGAELLTGGERVVADGLDRGCFVAPTIFDRVDPDNVIFREEIFGPVLSTTRFSDPREAIELANLTSYGLSNGVWTKDLDKAHVCARELRCGTVWVNTANDGAVQLPFGGYGHSGQGREKGAAGIEEFMEQKTVQIHLGRRRPAFQARV